MYKEQVYVTTNVALVLDGIAVILAGYGAYYLRWLLGGDMEWVMEGGMFISIVMSLMFINCYVLGQTGVLRFGFQSAVSGGPAQGDPGRCHRFRSGHHGAVFYQGGVALTPVPWYLCRTGFYGTDVRAFPVLSFFPAQCGRLRDAACVAHRQFPIAFWRCSMRFSGRRAGATPW